jgi:hypothetical protein
MCPIIKKRNTTPSRAMERICSRCAKDPSSHSFKKLSEKNGVCIFYSKPSDATLYNDTDGILEHIDKALATTKGKPWTCIIDADGFDMKHAMEVKTGMGILSLLTDTYGNTLQEIKIINPTWHIKGVMKVMNTLTASTILSKFKLLDDKPHSILEFI